MKIGTRKFGEIQIDEKTILTMPEGLPGFPGLERFVVLEDPKTAPFCWFQSVDDADLALVIMNPLVFKPDYDLDLEAIAADLGWKGISREELLVFVVVNIYGKEEDKQITANLIGPLVINAKNSQAAQVVLSNTTYSCQYNILNPEKTV